MGTLTMKLFQVYKMSIYSFHFLLLRRITLEFRNVGEDKHRNTTIHRLDQFADNGFILEQKVPRFDVRLGTTNRFPNTIGQFVAGFIIYQVITHCHNN